LTIPNTYSATWHTVFGATLPEETTAREIEFLARTLPLPAYRTVLDVCCGSGRHLAGLSALSYDMTGVERDPDIAQTAREAMPTVRVIEGDANRLSELLTGRFDGLVCLWASFGYGTPQQNVQLLESMAAILRPGGRLVLDVYNRGFFDTHTGMRTIERGSRPIVEHTRLDGNRLSSTLDYGFGVADLFSWQVFTPDELVRVARSAGLSSMLVCAGFDETVPASSEHARMQLVFERGQTRGV